METRYAHAAARILTICVVLAAAACTLPIGNNPSQNAVDSSEVPDGAEVPDGGGTPVQSQLSLFPFYPGAVWAFDVQAVDSKWIGLTPETEEDTGSFVMKVTSFDLGTLEGRLSLFGHTTFLTGQPFALPATIRVRENAGVLEVLKPSKSWECTWNRSGNPWQGGFMLVPDSLHPETQAVLPMGVDSGTIKAEFDNTTQQYITEEHTRRSSQRIDSTTGLGASSYKIYYNEKNSQFGSNMYQYSINISRKGYSIPIPDGTLVQGGEGAYAQIVNAWTPATGSEAEPQPIDTPVELWFVWPMDHASTEAALSVEGGPFAVAGSVEWLEDDHLRWTSTSPLPAGETVTVTLSATAKSAAGVNVPSAFSFEFETLFERDDQWREASIGNVTRSGEGEIVWNAGSVYAFVTNDGTNSGYTGGIDTGFVQRDSIDGYLNAIILEAKPAGPYVLLYSQWNSELIRREINAATGAAGALIESNTGVLADAVGATMRGDGTVYAAFAPAEVSSTVYLTNDSDWGTWTTAVSSINGYEFYSPALHFDENGRPTILWIDDDPGTYGGRLWLTHFDGSAWNTTQVGTHDNWRGMRIATQGGTTIELACMLGGAGEMEYGEKQLAKVELSTNGTINSIESLVTLGEEYYYSCEASSHGGRLHVAYGDDAGIAYLKETASGMEYHRLYTNGKLCDLHVDPEGYAHLLVNAVVDSQNKMVYLTNRP